MKVAEMDVDTKKRRLPKGTSAYQAAWILDNDFSDEETEEVDLQSPSAGVGSAQGYDGTEDRSWEDMDDAEVWLHTLQKQEQNDPKFRNFGCTVIWV